MMEQRALSYRHQSLNAVPELKRAMNLALKESRLSREQVADRMNAEITVERLRTRGKDGLVTTDMLNKWLAPESPEIIPTKLMKIFGTVLSTGGLAQAVAPEGYRMISPKEVLVLEYGQDQIEKRRINRKDRRLVEQIEEQGP